MKSWKVRMAVVLTMLMTMLLVVPVPAMAQGVEDQIQQVYEGGVIKCEGHVASGFIAQEDFDQCVEEHYLTNLQSLLEGLRATGRLTENADGVLNGLLNTSEQLT
jgi:hypothetical protein